MKNAVCVRIYKYRQFIDYNDMMFINPIEQEEICHGLDEHAGGVAPV